MTGKLAGQASEMKISSKWFVCQVPVLAQAQSGSPIISPRLNGRSTVRKARSLDRYISNIQSRAYFVLITIFFSNQLWAVDSASRQFFKRQDGVSVYFDLELANTASSRSEGLMWRRALQPGTGMLFDFEHNGRIRMWMKNTLISLDMIFLDEQKNIVYISEGAEPGSLKIIETPYDARFTVEINAGEVNYYGLSVGDSLFP